MALKKFVVPAGADGIRAADFLRMMLPDLPESIIRKVFSARDVKADGLRIPRDAVLRGMQEVCVYIPDRADTAPSSLRVVYEDSDVLLVNKPAGISVEDDGSISLASLCRQYAEQQSPGSFAPVPCHRLDARTCGLCLFARNENARAVLEEAFRSRTLEKYYICLVRGIPKPPEAECRAFLLKDAGRGRVQILDHPIPEARQIVTGYETLESGPVSRLKVHLVTGRTHQIRAHLASLGHPILGDDVYGDRDFNRRYKAHSLKLCAVSLKLDTGGKLPLLDGREFSIDPPF